VVVAGQTTRGYSNTGAPARPAPTDELGTGGGADDEATPEPAAGVAVDLADVPGDEPVLGHLVHPGGRSGPRRAVGR
jgi:hypothetical protein